MIIVEDIIRDVVKRTERGISEILPKTGIKYQFGTFREIIDNLIESTTADVSKYPLIALVTPFAERIVDNNVNLSTLRILICVLTDRNFKANKRLDVNFRTVLYPLYTEFMRNLSFVAGMEHIRHTKIDHFEFGKETLSGYNSSILPDNVDVLEIRDCEVYFKEKSNCIKQKSYERKK